MTLELRAKDALSVEEIEAELNRILAHPGFQSTQRRRSMLQYLVEEALAGRGNLLKEYTVGVSVFGRPEGYDPQADPVVRMEARRLRRDLDSYYIDAGKNDRIRFSIPKGGYVPAFELIEVNHAGEISEEADRESPIRVWNLRGGNAWLAALGVTIAALLIYHFANEFVANGNQDPNYGPAVVVLPFKPLGASEQNQYLASGLAAQLISDLMRFQGFRVYTRLTDNELDMEELVRKPGAHYVVNGSVAIESAKLDVDVQLMDGKSGQVYWSEHYNEPLQPDALAELRTTLAEAIAAEIGQPYGVVYTDLTQRRNTSSLGNMDSYVCVLRAYDYRQSFSMEKFTQVLNCLESAVKRDPEYSTAWAMLGWLYLDKGRFGFAGSEGVEKQYEQALQTANRAIELAPDDVIANIALSSIHHYMGHFEEGERLARHAHELNPYDSDIMAQLGWRLAVRGNFEEGIPLLEQAIQRVADPPGWYYHLICINDYLNGDFARMLEHAKRSAADGSSTSLVMIAIADAELGDAEGTRAALAKMSPDSLLSRDPRAYFLRHGATEQITESMVSALARARTFASAN